MEALLKDIGIYGALNMIDIFGFDYVTVEWQLHQAIVNPRSLYVVFGVDG